MRRLDVSRRPTGLDLFSDRGAREHLLQDGQETRRRGRALSREMFPFSFRECIAW